MDQCTPVLAHINISYIYSTYDLKILENETYGEDSDMDYLDTQGYNIVGGQPEENRSNSFHRNAITDHSVEELHEYIEQFLYKQVIIGICVFGLLGNILNLVVLTRKSLQKTMDRMEKSAHIGLVAMATSDMMFCLSVLPHSWVDTNRFHFSGVTFGLYYSIFSEAFINIFIMCSTWLTVTIATSRYLAICHPLRAREIIGMTFTKASMLVVFILCILFNLPRFWNETYESMDCVGGWSVYFRMPGYLKTNTVFQNIYMWLYFLIGILFPLLLLVFCNIQLIRALRQSAHMRKQYQNPNANTESTHRITLTLIIIVIMYLILVLPAEMIQFLKDAVIADSSITSSYNLSLAFMNCLQALNFSFNFVLYCVINVHFRTTMASLFCACRSRTLGEAQSMGLMSSYAKYESVSATTSV